MNTSLRFNAEVDSTKAKESLREFDEASKGYARRALERDIEAGRIKKEGEQAVLDLIEKQMGMKERQVETTLSAQKDSLRQAMSSEIDKAGPNIGSYQRKEIEEKYAGKFDSINQTYDTEKQTLEIQRQILTELRKQGEGMLSTPEGRAQLKEMDMNGVDPSSFMSAAYGRRGLSTGGGGMGGMLSGGLAKLAARLGPLALLMGGANILKGGYMAASNAETGEDFDIQMEKILWDTVSFGFLGDVMTAGEQRHRQARTAFNKEAAMTMGVSGSWGPRMDWGSDYGMTSTQLQPMYRQLMQATFSDPVFLQGIVASKGIGVDQNSAMGLAGLGAMNQSNFASTMGLLTQELQSGSVDQSMTQNIMGAVLSLANTQKSTLNMVNTDPIMGAALSLRTVGGSFATDLSGRMNTINNALTDPSNDFQKITSYDILSGLEGVGNSWVDIEMAREKGIAQEGYLSAVMTDEIGRSGGNRDSAIMNLKSRLGLSVSDSNALYEKFKSNPEMFDNLDQFEGDEDAVMEYLTGKGEDATSREEKWVAKATEGFITSADAGREELIRQSKILAEIRDALIEPKDKISSLTPANMDGKNEDGSRSFAEYLWMGTQGGIKS